MIRALRGGMMNASKVAGLKAGGRVTLSEANGVRVVAERSSNGTTLRVVRVWRDGFSVVSSRGWPLGGK